MRLLELIEGSDGRLDEQSALSILFGLTLIGLTVYVVVVRHVQFEPLTFAGAAATFLTGSLGMLTVRSHFSRDGQDVSQPPGN
jgi:hypothetical protein